MNRQRKILIFSSLVLIGVMGVIILSQLPPNWLKPSYLVNLSSVLTLISFRGMSRREFLKLLKLGDWKEGEKGEVLASANEPNTRLSILSHGEAIALENNRQLIKSRFTSKRGRINQFT